MKIFHLDFRFLKLRSGKSLMRKFQLAWCRREPGGECHSLWGPTSSSPLAAVLAPPVHCISFRMNIYINMFAMKTLGSIYVSLWLSLSLASFTNGIFRKQNECRQCENVTWIHLKANKRGKHCDQSFIMSNVLHRANLSTQISPQKTSVIWQN